MIVGFKSINTILAKLYRDLELNSELSENSVYEWIAEALSLIGAYSQYNEISHCLTLTNGKAKLPCGFYKLVDINYKGHPMYWATNTNAHNYQCHECRIKCCSGGKSEYTFYINDSYLISNIEDDKPNDTEANVCMVYLGVPVDDNNLPMVPDDVYYDKALTAYVTYMIDRQEWRKGKIADKIKDESEKEWLFYVRSARGSANMPNTAQLEGLKSTLLRLLPMPNDYSKGFKNFNKGENINLR